jgi:CheY-like chemotaxis protein
MSKKILLVEDERVLIKMYQETFSRAGFEVHSAETVQEGIKLTKELKPDLVLLDILLPEVNGLEFLKEIKKDPSLSAIPIVAFSNYTDPETQEKALELGARDYVVKADFDPDETLEIVKKYIR